MITLLMLATLAQSPAEEARQHQIREALGEAQKARWPACVWISERVCVSEAELKRRKGK